MLPGEQRFLKGAQAFDISVLAEIYDSYSPALYAYSMRLLGSTSLAEECVSETFTRFLDALKRGRGPRNYLRAYLYRTAHNWITDQYRRQPPPPLELDEWLNVRSMPETEGEVDLHLNREELRQAIWKLTPEQRQVILLRFVEEWDLNEVSVAMQKPVGAIKALQHRAIENLRRILVQEGED